MKTKLSRQLLALLLTLALLLSLLPTAFAASPAVRTEEDPVPVASIPEDLTGKTVILHTNDTHGALLGFAQVAQVKADLEAKGASVILVDAGDYSQGAAYVSLSKGESAITVMNAAGYDIATLGNHEFDYGWAQLQANLEKAEFQIVVADVIDEATGKSVYDGHVIKEVGGVKIGFFGMETPEAATKANPALIQGLLFPQEEEMYAIAQAEIDALKSEGADIIIGLTHLGVDDESEPNRSIDLWANVTGVDFIIDGHSHTVMTAGPNGEPIQSTGTKASDEALMNVGCIVIDNAAKKIELNELIPLGADAPKDEAVAAVAQEIMDAVNAEYNVVFAVSEVELNGDRAPGNRNMETNLGDLITDSMLWAVQKTGGLTVDEAHTVAVTNGGGIRAWIHAGDVTKKDVNTVLPFGNTVAVVYVTGAELLEALEASTYCTPTAVGGFPQIAGMKINIDTTKAFLQDEQYPGSTYYGPKAINRVSIDEVGGEPFDPEATYAVITNNFCAAGGDTYYAFAAATNQFDTGLPLDEVLMDYITEELEGTITQEDYAEPQGRITFEERAGALEGKTVILHTNDTHGALLGFAQVADVKATFEAQGANVLLVDAGDYSQGAPYVSLSKGETAITVMNAAGYDIATLGNHEFDYGWPQLQANLEKAEFQIIVADVIDEATGKSVYDGHVIKEFDGVKIGFFGMETPEAATKANPALIQGLIFPQEDEMYACAQAEIDALKAEGADIIIGLTHLGVDDESIPNRSIDLFAKVEGIDFIIDGHSHTVMTEGPNGEPIQSTGTKASDEALMNVGCIVIDNAAKKIEKNELIPLGADAPKDEAVAAVAQEIMDAVNAEYDVVFATSEVELNGDRAPGNRNMETNLGDLITDSMLWAVKKTGGLTVDDDHVVAITNGGGIRAWIHAGDVTKKNVNTVLPFGNTVAVVYVTGAELLEALEASTYCTPTAVGGFPQIAGMKINIETEKAFDQGAQYPGSTYYGPASIQRVTIENVNGAKFNAKDTYAVITNNFCAAGGDTYYAFAAATNQFDTGLPLDEVLMDYITEELNGVIPASVYAEPQGRITEEFRFDDVKDPSKFYFEPVYWAFFHDPQITNGTSDTMFSPNKTCTRGQVVTFLWRAMGCPEPTITEHNFTDVKETAYYYKAMLWAVENGITTGTSETTFGPNKDCTRGQVVTFMWRAAGEPEPTSTEHPFTDVKESGYYFKAMLWAIEAGITNGTSETTFSPNKTATRGQVVTFLQRAAAFLEPEQPKADYVLFGWINGADYACEGDAENAGEYVFVDGKLTAAFTEDSYVAVKLSDNSAWFMTDGWLGTEVTSAILYNTETLGENANKLYVPGNVEIEFTLEENEDGTLTLSYEAIKPETTEFEFLVTSDLHGQIYATDYTAPYANSGTYSRGLTRVSTYIKEQKELFGDNVYVVDMGDTFQGAPLTYYYAFNKPDVKDPAILAFRSIGYDMWVVGNHEFNYGLQILTRQMDYAVSEGDENEKQLTISLANYLKAETNSDESKDWATWRDVAPYVIKDFGGYKVAIIGFGNPNIPKWDVPANWEGIYFANIIETYQHYEAEMLEQADMIVVVAHSGIDSDPGSDFIRELVASTNTIAFAFSGHEHRNAITKVENTDGKEISILSPYTKARRIAQVKVTVEDGEPVIEPKLVNMENYPIDEELAELLKPYEIDTWENYMLQPIGQALGDYPAANLGTAPSAFMDLINTVQAWGAYDRTGENTPDKTEDDVKPMLSISAPLTSGNNANLISEGPIVLGDMFGLYRFENWFYQITMNGEEVHQWLEFAATKIQVDGEGNPYVTNGDLTYYDVIMGDGFHYEIDVSKPAGERVVVITYNGEPVTAETQFTVVVNNYRYNGGGNYVSWLNDHGCEFIANDPDRIIYSTQFDMIQGEDEGQARALLVSYIKMMTEAEGGITPFITSDWIVRNGGETTEPEYYLVGTMTDWEAREGYKLTAMRGEYILDNIELPAGAGVKVKDETNNLWYPDGMDNEFVIEETGCYKVVFNPEGGQEGYYEGFFQMEKLPDPDYYLVGTISDWAADPAYKLSRSENVGEWVLENVSLPANAGVKVKDETNNLWYPDGMDNEYVVPETGTYNLSFYPAGGQEDCHEGFFKLEKVEAPLTLETTFPSATKADIDKYGDVHFSISSADLAAAGFEYKDLVKLTFLDQEVIVPIIPQYRYVGAKAPGLVMWEDGTKPAEVEVFNGSFAATYGLADVVRDGSDYTVTPRPGVEFPVPVVIEMYEKQGYADTYAIFDLTRSNDREDYRGNTEPYPNLTDEEFANFRVVDTTGMGENKLYRSSSPINPSIGRNGYADAASAAANVKSFVNLADSAESAAKYAGYADTYYSQQEICFLNLGVDFTTELNRAGLVEAMDFLKDCPTPVLVHCNEGQDRAGFVSALLECLMGATYDEVVADYMVTFYNYYGVQEGTDQYAQISNNIIKNLKTAFGVEDLAAANLAEEAEAYFLELGVSAETIAAVKVNLSDGSEPEEPAYVLFGYINGANYGCEEDFENPGEYVFEDGKLTATFTEDSYVAVKFADNSAWFMTNGWLGTEVTSAILYNTEITGENSNKLYVPGNIEFEFTLEENEDGTLTLSYAPAGEETALTTDFPSTDNADIEKYGNIFTSLSSADFFEAGFTWGDVVTVKFLEQELELPVVPTYSYVDTGSAAVIVGKDGETGEPYGRVKMAINMGDFATTYGLAYKTTNPDKTYYWTANEGVEFPVTVTIEMKEKEGYLAELLLHDIVRTNNREDYPELTDAEFANFRQIATTGMGDHLYRGSSPINPEIGRNTYADAALEEAKVTVIMNLANDQATAEAYEGYADTYYSGQNIIFLNLGVDFQAEDFQAGLANGLRHFAENEGVYYVHCTEGKDRAGFVSALLECLMGATYDEVVADYLKTYTNYYTVVDGVQQPLPEETLDAIANSNIIKTLQTAFGVEDLKTADLAAEAEEYIAAIGLSEDEITALKANLAGEYIPPEVPEYFLVGTMTEWEAQEDYLLAPVGSTGEFVLEGVALEANAGVKIKDATNDLWYPDGMDNEYVVEEAGTYNVSFFPAGGQEGYYEGFFKLEPVDDSLKFEVLPDGSNMLKYGHIDLDIPVADFLELFALGDIVSVEVNGYAFDAPVVTNYDDVDTGAYLVRCASGKTVTTLAINYGQVGVAAGIIELAPEGSNPKYQLVDGLEWPMYATIELKEAGGYADELSIRKLTRTNVRSDYADLSDEEFANFRVVGTTGMGSNALYRTSSPIDPELGRNTYADAAAQAAGVKTFINLADTQEEAEAFPGYANSYYSTQTKLFLALPVAFTSDEFKAGLANGYKFIVNNDGPYLIHCLEGKDRTGLSVGVLEALMGATLAEIQADYLKTYENYFEVQNNEHIALTEAQVAYLKGIITKNLGIIFDVEDMETANLAEEAEAFLTETGLTAEEIAALKVNLGKTWEVEVPVDFYLVGDMTNWETQDAYKLSGSDTEGMFILENVALTANTGVKVKDSEGGWYPDPGDNYVVPEDGTYNLSFFPAGGQEGYHYGFFKLEKTSDLPEPTSGYVVADSVAAGDKILYVVEYNDALYAMTNDTSINNALGVVAVTADANGVIASADSSAVWTLEAGETSGTFKVKENGGKYINYGGSGTSLSLKTDSSTDFAVVCGAGSSSLKPNSGRQIFLRDNNGALQFRCYATSNLSADGYCSVLTIYKWVDG